MAESDEISESLSEPEWDGKGFICLFCKKSMTKMCRIPQNAYLLSGMSSISIKYYKLPQVEDFSCYNCVKGILILADQRRIIQRNILKNRANYFMNNGNTALCAKYLAKMMSFKNQSFSPNPGLKIVSVRSIEKYTDGNQSKEHASERMSMPSTSRDADSGVSSPKALPDNSSDTYLDVYYTTTEPAIFSESGGGLAKEQETKSPTIKSYSCAFCSKTYTSERFFIKHEKKHTDKRRTATHSVRTYRCLECGEVYSTLVQLRSHKKEHKTKFTCEYCGEQCFVKGAFEFHQAICSGKMAAQESGRRPFTRSQKAAYSDTEPESDEELDTDDEIVDCNRDRAVDNWICELTSSTPSERCEVNSQYTSFTRASSRYNDFSDTESQFSSVSRSRRLNTKNSIRTSIRRSKRLKKKKDFDICSEVGCHYQCENKKLLMLHEKNVHCITPAYHCKECGSLFTKRIYYEQHMPKELKGKFTCNRCEKVFTDGYLFKNHCDEHKIVFGCDCATCLLSFLTEREYLKHLCSEEHLQRKQARKSIFIEKVSYGKETVVKKPYRSKYRAIYKGMLLMDQLRPKKNNIPDLSMVRFLDKHTNTDNLCINHNAPSIIIKTDYGKNINT